MSASSKLVVAITGANTGLGLEVVKALAGSTDRAYSIILAGRSPEKVERAIETVKKEHPNTKSDFDAAQVDLESDESITKAYEKISSKYNKIDALINNGGASFDRYIDDGSMTIRQAWNKSWDVNVTGSQVMTHTFMPLLLKSKDPRLMFLASGTASLEESFNEAIHYNKSPPAGWPKTTAGKFSTASYRSAKVGLNMCMREWEKTLREDGVKVFAISPGFLATNLGGNPEMYKKFGAGDPANGGHFIKDVVDGNRDADAGKTIRVDRVQPW